MDINKVKNVITLAAATVVLSMAYAFMNVRSYTDSNFDFELEINEDSLLPPPIIIASPPLPEPQKNQIKKEKRSPKENPNILELTDKNIQPKPKDEITDLNLSDLVPEIDTKERLDSNLVIKEPVYFASEMPYFEACADFGSNKERFECTKRLIHQHIKSCFRTPDFLVETSFQGDVAVKFIVNENGGIEDVQVLYTDHELLNPAAVNALKCLPQFVPGKNNGTSVKVIYQQNIKLRN